MIFKIKQITSLDMTCYREYTKTNRGWECWCSGPEHNNLNSAYKALEYYKHYNEKYLEGKDTNYYIVEEYK